jgi:Cu(I)/Ag(I) efflux system membrane fusion protein
MRTTLPLVLFFFAAIAGCRGSDHDAAAHDDDKKVIYTCPMHPNVRQDHPGQCPICHMDLVPLDGTASTTAASGNVTLHPPARALAGMTLEAASERTLSRRVRAPGRVVLDQTRVFDVTLRVGGYVSRLFADAEGTLVNAGAPVLWLDSPELVAAQQELLRALRGSQDPAADALVQATSQRLRVWGLSDAQIDELKASLTVLSPVPITATQSGVVVEKDVVVGQRVEAGQRIARLARLDKVWVEADVFPDDAGALAVGQTAEVRVLGDAGAPITGRVSRVLPRADEGARSLRVRIDVGTEGTRLLIPGAAVVAEVLAQERQVLAVPRDAVIRTGARDVVFVDVGNDQLQLRVVTLGAHDADHVEISAGLTAGERVVTRAAFLVAAESRLRVPAQWDATAARGKP